MRSCKYLKSLAALTLFSIMALSGIVLLWVGRLTGTSFNGFISIGAIIAGAVYFGDRLLEIDFKSLKIVLAEMKEIRSDVYAKADDVRSMMVDLADSIIDSALETGRVPADDLSLQREMLSKRKRARALLSRTGTSESEISRRVGKITAQVADDLLQELERRVEDAFQEKTHPDKPCFGLYKGPDPALWDRVVGKAPPEILDSINAYIREKGFSPDDFNANIGVLKYFMEQDALPDIAESKEQDHNA